MRKVNDKGISTDGLIENAGTITTVFLAFLGGLGAFLKWLLGMHRRHVLMEEKLDSLTDRMDKMEERSEIRAAENAELLHGMRVLLARLEDTQP